MPDGRDTSAPLREFDTQASTAPDDAVIIRGVRLPWQRLVNPCLFDAGYRESLRQQLRSGAPFEHVVVDDWFDAQLLRLVREEFDLFPFRDERELNRRYESTLRSPRYPVLGPASQTYFGLVNSGWFVALLSSITQVDELIADASLQNGGLHESRHGGRFGVHRDFERNACTGLKTEMVLITYLDEGWSPEWNGALELWDATRSQCVSKVEPRLGRTILMRNSEISYHGHPQPLNMPAGQVRRSLAAYYYTNTPASDPHRTRTESLYLFVARSDRLKRALRQLTPPVVWEAIKRLLR
jgi:hypothetical protein